LRTIANFNLIIVETKPILSKDNAFFNKITIFAAKTIKHIENGSI